MTFSHVFGIDTGGTFTDFALLSLEGELRISKCLSSPEDPSHSILMGLKRATAHLSHPFSVVHGTTVATNALLERKGAKTALITTQGFRDILHIARQNRDTLYSLHPHRATPLLSREACFEAKERLDWQGKVITALAQASAEQLIEQLHTEGYESLAICLLFGYLNPEHEHTLGEMARKRGFTVSLASEIAPEPREYERANTTVANALVAPIMQRYLSRLNTDLQALNVTQLRVMQSNGGALSAEEASQHAIKTALSGPAGGVVAAIHLGKQAGYSNLLTFDMGGTSADVALIMDGNCPVSTQATFNGLPLRTPMLDIHTVGAGGGSLARLDRAGGLRVGPESAGANPGPIAYGKGERLTVTDANLLLGRLPTETRLAGETPLHFERTREFGNVFAAQLSTPIERVAHGVIEVINSVMVRALRHISLERGHEPSQFTLLSYGGAGGLHACALAEAVGIHTVLIPRYPGAFSALGLALADVRREIARAIPPTGDLTKSTVLPRFPEICAAMGEEADQQMRREGFPKNGWRGEFLLDLRYLGQSFSLRTPYVPRLGLEKTVKRFHTLHKARYGYADPKEPVEAVAVRLIAVAQTPKPNLQIPLPSAFGTPISETQAYFNEQWHKTPLYLREHLALEQIIEGPAIILQEDATTLIPPHWKSQTDSFANLLLTRS